MNPNEPTVWERGADPNGSVSAQEALHGLALGGAHRLAPVRLDAVVGATLRAAVDLLLGDPPSRRPIQATFDDGALDLVLPEVDLAHLTAAGALLETVGGSLGPAREGRAFRMRVPVAGPRAFYLMLEQGTLALAIPWHAVIRIRLAPPEALEGIARREGCPVLPPIVSVPATGAERPAVLVALGLRRAFLIADRLVWRMPADPAPASDDDAPGASLGPAVRTSDGEIFRVADPERLLQGVEPPPLPAPTPRQPSPPPPAPAKTPPLPRPQSAPRILELRPEDVEPLPEPAPPAPVAAPEPEARQPEPEAPPPPAPRAPDPPPTRAARPERRALVVEDSIVGRIFLQRLLEAEGYSVESVATASELRHARGVQRWELLFIDVSLPDSPRGEHLKGVASGSAVALVRDAHDEKVAAAAGVRLTLRKPFEKKDLVRVLESLRLGREAS